jgi:hypothetical protein
VQYFGRLVRQTFDRTKPILIWLESDGFMEAESEMFFHQLSLQFSACMDEFQPISLHQPSQEDSLLTVLHRMVMADGLVCSESSLSHTAALLSNSTFPIVVPALMNERRHWHSSPRFQRLKVNSTRADRSIH